MNVFLVVNFHHFENIKKANNINKIGFRFLGKKKKKKKKIEIYIYIYIYNFTSLFILHYIILQWVLGLVAKIYKYFSKFVPIWLIAKAWLNFLVDDVIIIITIYNALIYFI